jgi:hypothetical protein
MQSLIDLTQHTQRKGLNPNKPYLATVVDNNDPAQLLRIRARVPGFFDHVPDDRLPWCIVLLNHPQGLKGGSDIDRSGSACIPRRDSNVVLYFPSEGDPMQPQYSTNLPWDNKNKLPEFLENYPDRQGTKMDNGYTQILDTKTNEIFIINPGDANITILGDTNVQVIGNLQCLVASDTSSIPDYLLNAPATVLNQLSPDPQKRIEFLGLHGGSSGNMHFEVEKNFTVKAGGNMKFDVGGDISASSKGKHTIESKGNYKVKAPRIDLN